MNRFPLLLLHHAGGSAAVFNMLVKELPAAIEPLPLELPGRGRRWRENLLTTVDDALDDLTAAAVASIHGEFAVFGHSLGAYLGLALAGRWEERGLARCTVLFASANAGPVKAVLPFSGSPLLTTDEEIFAVAAESGGGVSPQITASPKLRARTAGLLRADFALSESFLRSYRNTVIASDIVVCAGTEDIFSDLQLEQWSFSSATGTKVHHFPGDHFYLESDAKDLAQIVAGHVLAGTR